MEEEIRRVLAEHGKLAVDVDTIGEDDDLYRAGLTSHASINLMLGLEDAFDLEFPQHMLRKKTFETISSIRAALNELTGSTVR